MRIIVATITIMISCEFVAADYEPTSLPQLIVESDLIVQGEIVDLDSASFNVKITEIIKGEVSEKILHVNRFEDWTCSSRTPDYQIGQKEIIFLTHQSQSDKWMPMGAANEGEFQVENDSIVYQDIFYDTNSGCTDIYQYGYNICGWVYSLSDFKSGIRFYISEFPQIEDECRTENVIQNRHENNPVYCRIVYESVDYFSNKFMMERIKK